LPIVIITKKKHIHSHSITRLSWDVFEVHQKIPRLLKVNKATSQSLYQRHPVSNGSSGGEEWLEASFLASPMNGPGWVTTMGDT